MQTKTYVLFPEGSCVENTQRFWAGKARLAHEGKDLASEPLDITCAYPHAVEIVVLAYENWDKSPTVASATHWAQIHGHSVRVLNPYTWKELPFTQKVLSRRKSSLPSNSKTSKAAPKPKRLLRHETCA